MLPSFGFTASFAVGLQIFNDFNNISSALLWICVASLLAAAIWSDVATFFVRATASPLFVCVASVELFSKMGGFALENESCGAAIV